MRRALSDAEAARHRAARQLSASVKRKTKKRTPSVPKATLEQWHKETEQMLGETDCQWEPCHLVVLYLKSHKWCYGVDDSLTGTEVYRAVCSAATMVKREYRGDYRAAIDFIRWAWREEKRKEAWAIEQGISRNRLTWRHLFMFKDLHVSYRLEQERAKVYARRQG